MRRRRAPRRITSGFLRHFRRRRKNKKSNLEKIVEGWLKDLKIPFRTQYKIGRCHVDVFLPETNTIVEIAGCFWHGHSCLGKDNITARHLRARRRDANRFRFFKNAGYSLAILWGCQIERRPVEAWLKLVRATGIGEVAEEVTL